MKEMYQCEKCGKIHDSYDDAYKCENSHISIADADEFNSQVWNFGDIMPRDVVLQSANVWDENAQEYRHKYAVYTLKKMLTQKECDAIDKAKEEKQQKEREEWEEYMRRREERKKAEEAERSEAAE